MFVTFPVPSEAFARVELRGLREAGCRLSVSTLRGPPPEATRLLAEHELAELEISYGGLPQWFRGIREMARRPAVVARLARLVAEGFGEKPRDALVGLAILPRAFGIARRVQEAGDVDRVHLFWGHFPSLVGLALKELDRGFPVSMFLGAYDLVRRFPPSRWLARQVPVTTHTRANLDWLRDFAGLEPDQVAVIHRGIRVPPEPSAGARADRPHIVVAERLIPEKRTADGIEVFKTVVRTFPDAVLTVLGEGPERRRLELLVDEAGLGDGVRLRGHIPHREVQQELARAHIYLSMSQSPGERLPNAAKEAMAARCAVVVARTPGIDELVVDGQTGFVVGPGDIESAAERVAELLGDPQRMEGLGRKGRERIVSSFDISRTTKQRLALWNLDVPERVQ